MKNVLLMATFTIAVSAMAPKEEDKSSDITMEVEGIAIKAGRGFLFKMQDFLNKVLMASSKKKGKMGWRTAKQPMHINSFFQNLCSIFGILEKPEIKVIADAIKDEVAARHKNDHYKALLKIPIVRRSLEITLQTLKTEPPRVWEKIAKKLKAVGESSADLSDSPQKTKDKESSARDWANNVVSRSKSLFGQNKHFVPAEYEKILEDLEEYLIQNHIKRKQNRESPEQDDVQKSTNEESEKKDTSSSTKLEKIVENAMKIVDVSLNVDKDNLAYIQQSLQYLWWGPNIYDPNKSVITKPSLERVDQNQKYAAEHPNTMKHQRITTKPTIRSDDDWLSSENVNRGRHIQNKDGESQSALESSDETAQPQERSTTPTFTGKSLVTFGVYDDALKSVEKLSETDEQLSEKSQKNSNILPYTKTDSKSVVDKIRKYLNLTKNTHKLRSHIKRRHEDIQYSDLVTQNINAATPPIETYDESNGDNSEFSEDIPEGANRRSMLLGLDNEPTVNAIKRKRLTSSKNLSESSLKWSICNSNNSKCDIKSRNSTSKNQHNSAKTDTETFSEWSSESKALYTAIKKQSKRLPLREYLKHEDVEFLRNLNISVSNEGATKRNTNTVIRSKY